MINIIIFDSSGNNIKISNTPIEIERLLSDSPIVNEKDKLVGVILNAENKYGTTLYEGNIYITDVRYKKFKIINHRICYKEPPTNDIYDAINIITIIKEVVD